MNHLQVGIRLHDMEQTTLERRLAIAHEQGFRCIHLASKLIYSEYGIDRHGLTPGLAAHIRRECAKNSLDIAVYGCYLNLANPDPGQLQEIIEEYKANIRFASFLGTPLVGTETGAPNTTYTFCPQCHEEAAFLIFLENLRTVTDYAASFGIVIAIEPVWKHIVFNPRRTRQALDLIGTDHLQIIFDPVNLLCPENHTSQDSIFREMLRLNGKDIALLHLKDYSLENGSMTAHAPGVCGNLNYAEILRWQREKAPYLQATIENSTPENAVESRLFLENF